jgi:hypothetical protein
MKPSNTIFFFMTILSLAIFNRSNVQAQQTNNFETLKDACQKREQTILAQYGKALEAIMQSLKQRGDLDTYLVVESEKKRFETEQAIPALSDAKDAYRPAVESYFRSKAELMQKYAAALGDLIRQLMLDNKISEAKVVKIEKDAVESILAAMPNLPAVKIDVVRPGRNITGGIITKSGIYRIHIFTNNGIFQIEGGSLICKVLIVAGGGGGGGNNGGGGGGGGIIMVTNVFSNGTYSITVGAGGAGGNNTGGDGACGGDSVVGAWKAIGGGGGGARILGARDGGSGGGENDQIKKGVGKGIPGQGYDGGRCANAHPTYGQGGGGGAGGAGGNADISVTPRGGNGGKGYLSDISGLTVTFSSGGGGSSYYYNGTGADPKYGLGGTGGGNGAVVNKGKVTRECSSATGYGCGGGGGGPKDVGCGPGGSGYQGIVIIRYHGE